jgi:hypothetical protein
MSLEARNDWRLRRALTKSREDNILAEASSLWLATPSKVRSWRSGSGPR